MLTLNNDLAIGVLSDEAATTDPSLLGKEYMDTLEELCNKFA
jgi:hypothetical protein